MSELPDDAVITFDMVVTLDDQLRMTEYLWDQPKFRRRRLLSRAAIVVIVPLAGMLLGTTLAWLSDPTTPFRDVFTVIWSSFGTGTLPLAILPGLLVLVFVLQRLARPWLLRRRLRRLRRERPGVDPEDPTLGEAAACKLGPEGFTSTASAATVQLQWRAIKMLAETPGQIMIKTGELTGFIVPKRCLTPGQLEAIRAMVARRIVTNAVTGPAR